MGLTLYVGGLIIYSGSEIRFWEMRIWLGKISRFLNKSINSLELKKGKKEDNIINNNKKEEDLHFGFIL